MLGFGVLSWYHEEKHQVAIQHKRAQCYGGVMQICMSSNSDVALAIKYVKMGYKRCSGTEHVINMKELLVVKSSVS